MQPLVGQLVAPLREEHPPALEQRQVRHVAGDVVARHLEQTRDERRAHHRLLLAERVRDRQHPRAQVAVGDPQPAHRLGRDEAERHHLAQPRAAQLVLDPAPQLLRPRQRIRPRGGAPAASRGAAAARARARPPRSGRPRGRRRSGGSTAPRPRGRRRAARRRSRGARGSPATPRARSARPAASRAGRCAARSRCGSGSGAATSTVPGTIRAPHSSTISRAARRCACSARRGMQLLLEAVAGLGAQAELLGRLQDVGAVPGRRLHRDPRGVRADLAARRRP